MTWEPLETAPEDEIVLLSTTGGWVDTAFHIDGTWEWFRVGPLHSNHVPLGWKALPKGIDQ